MQGIRSELIWAGGLILSLMSVCAGQEYPVNLAPTKSQINLVAQLGADSFKDREAARRQLFSQGLAARRALLRGLQHRQLEVRLLAHQILQDILTNNYEEQLKAFVADEQNAMLFDLPGWQQFQSATGSNRITRQLFATMLRTEARLLHALESDGRELEELYLARLHAIRPLHRNPQRGDFIGLQEVPVIDSLTLATLLLVGCHPRLAPHTAAGHELRAMLEQEAARNTFRQEEHQNILRALLAAWITSADGQTHPYLIFELGLRYGLAELVLPNAEQTLQQGQADPVLMQYAILAVGKYCSDREKRIKLLHGALGNREICNRWEDPELKKDGTIDTQVRDVALAVLICLTKHNPEDYGFRFLQEHNEMFYRLDSFGFVTNADREKAHQRWQIQSAPVVN